MLRSRVGLLAGLALVLAFVPVAQASVINAQASVINMLPGDTTIAAFGSPDTSLYAQGLVADGTQLDALVVGLASDGTGTLAFELLFVDALDLGGGLYAPDMTSILSSQSFSLLPTQTSMTYFGAMPNVAVTSGNHYFIVLDAFSPAGEEAYAAVAGWSDDQYADGEFLFMNANDLGLSSLADANNYTWDAWPYTPDMAFLASFSNTAVVPEPVTISMLALGIAGLVVRRRLF